MTATVSARRGRCALDALDPFDGVTLTHPDGEYGGTFITLAVAAVTDLLSDGVPVRVRCVAQCPSTPDEGTVVDGIVYARPLPNGTLVYADGTLVLFEDQTSVTVGCA